MIFKAICVEDNSFKMQLFEMFGRDMLIESLLRVEDTVRIAITDLLSSFLEEYFKDNKYIDRILQNLTQTLKLTDDIEGSVIFGFNLINQIIHHKAFDTKVTSFKFHLSVFCPFNFHRVVLVRRTYNTLVTKFLKLGLFTFEDLLTLHTLTVQSIIMEQDAHLKSQLIVNLQLLCAHLKVNQAAYVNYLNSNLLLPERF